MEQRRFLVDRATTGLEHLDKTEALPVDSRAASEEDSRVVVGDSKAEADSGVPEVEPEVDSWVPRARADISSFRGCVLPSVLMVGTDEGTATVQCRMARSQGPVPRGWLHHSSRRADEP